MEAVGDDIVSREIMQMAVGAIPAATAARLLHT
jgi:hypothetical protein